MTDNTVLSEVRGKIGLITINRPKVLNSLNTPVILELEQALDAHENNEQVRVIVITGAGERAFVAGGDISEMASREGIAHYQEFAEDIHRVFRRFEACDKPTIAAVNGYALGGGTELLLSLDIRLLADSAKLGLPEITLGLFPGGGGTQRLIRQISPCMAKELMFTGDRIDAEQAVRLGLANWVVPAATLLDEALALAEKIADKSPVVLKMLKRVLREGAEMPPAAALAHEQALISLVFDTEDAHEGMSAFAEKREAEFHGR
jgi:enoyl-CoA hydratase